MQTCLDFLEISVEFVAMVMRFQIIPGVTIWTMLLYNLLLVVFVTAFTRR